MPQSISPSIVRKCKLCGQEFHPTARKQACCNQVKIIPCKVCSKPIEVRCNTSYQKSTCSKECNTALIKQNRESSAGQTTKECKWCGKLFIPTSVRDVYCKETHNQKCVVCGNMFEIDVRRDSTVSTCSKECRYKLAKQHTDNAAMVNALKATMQERYNVDNAMHIPESVDKLKQTNNEKYGTDWYTQTDEYKDKVQSTSLSKYGVTHHLAAPEVIAKREETCIDKYGVTNVMYVDEIARKPLQTYQARTGYRCQLVNPEVRSNIAKKLKMSCSTLEKRIAQLLDQYKIKYEQHYMLSNGEVSHEFDFHLPDVKMLIDGDGLFFHSYLDDPNGKQVLDYYDEDRLALVPEGYHIHVIPEGEEEREIKKLSDYLHEHHSLDEYDTEIFKWCRSIEFPYPQYDEKRMLKDYASLKKYKCDKYVPQARLGDSIIQNYHKSIYSARVNKYASPVEGWYNDEMLKQVIRNRLIYMNDLNPSKVLRGFNISKTCPRVSVFNPVLAKYLTEKYLSEYDIVFDPFSGFSGRLLGVTAAGKKYIGQDLNSQAVIEANEIIKLLDLDGQVTNKDTLHCCGIFDCILTCPPYNDKEMYSNESVFKTCDEWIDLIRTHYKARKYVFVVDKTDKYQDYVVEEIKATSHLNKVKELVIVI